MNTISQPNPSLEASASNPAAESRAALGQLALSVIVLVIFAALFGIAQLAMANGYRLTSRRVAEWKRRPLDEYIDRGFFRDDSSRLLYEDIPNADYSRGGVYFTGASELGRGLTLWDWPAGDRQWVHDYCLPGSYIGEQTQFLQYLIDYEGLLKAGGGKTVIIPELFFPGARQSDTKEFNNLDEFVVSEFNKAGIFNYNPKNGIHAAPVSRSIRSFNIAALRSNVFWNGAQQLLGLAEPAETFITYKKIDPAPGRVYALNLLGPNWQADMDIELGKFATSIDQLQAQHVTVAAVYMPQATWADNFAPAIRFRQKTLQLLASRNVEVLDLSRACADTDFADLMHLNYLGTEKIQPALIALAEKYIHKIESAGQ